MEDVFDEVLALCLDRMADGDTPPTCAAEFPDFPDLLPLLELAAALMAIPAPEPAASWLTSSRDRLTERLNAEG